MNVLILVDSTGFAWLAVESTEQLTVFIENHKLANQWAQQRTSQQRAELLASFLAYIPQVFACAAGSLGSLFWWLTPPSFSSAAKMPRMRM